MFRKREKEQESWVRKATGPAEIDTIIGANAHFRGDIQHDGDARIDGVFEGRIDITGNLIIAEEAKVIADIKANNISVSGAVKGDISGSKVEILEDGCVWGDLKVDSLLLDEGAYLRGQTTMAGDREPPMIEAPKGMPEEPEPVAPNIVDVEPKAKEGAEAGE